MIYTTVNLGLDLAANIRNNESIPRVIIGSLVTSTISYFIGCGVATTGGKIACKIGLSSKLGQYFIKVILYGLSNVATSIMNRLIVEGHSIIDTDLIVNDIKDNGLANFVKGVIGASVSMLLSGLAKIPKIWKFYYSEGRNPITGYSYVTGKWEPISYIPKNLEPYYHVLVSGFEAIFD